MRFQNGTKSNKRILAQQNTGMEISFIYEEGLLNKTELFI